MKCKETVFSSLIIGCSRKCYWNWWLGRVTCRVVVHFGVKSSLGKIWKKSLCDIHWNNCWMEFLVAMLFIESITLVRKYEFSPIPSPPFTPPQGASPPLRLLLINRDVRAARHGGAVLARRLLLVLLLLLKQDGCARRRSSGGELRQCRGGGRGGRGIHSSESCPAKRAPTAQQRKTPALLTWCWLASVTI